MATVALVSSSTAQTGTAPTISGDPLVGETLTSTSVGDSGVYKWQRCDPDATGCSETDAHGDGDWAAIEGAEGQEFRAYTLTSADLGLVIRVVAKGTSTGQQWVGSNLIGPVMGDAGPPPLSQSIPPPPPQEKPTPQHGVKLIGEPVGGTVPGVKVPGTNSYVPLTQLTEIPVGSIIDTRGGTRIKLTAATGGFGNTTPDESVDFWGGLFKITQPASTNANATAKLVEKLSCNGNVNGGLASASGAGPLARAAGPRKRKMWGSGTGSYATAGKGGTGSVRGTTWFTRDGCKGTRFGVTEGLGITVLDKAKDKRIALGPGEKYFARLP